MRDQALVLHDPLVRTFFSSLGGNRLNFVFNAQELNVLKAASELLTPKSSEV